VRVKLASYRLAVGVPMCFPISERAHEYDHSKGVLCDLQITYRFLEFFIRYRTDLNP